MLGGFHQIRPQLIQAHQKQILGRLIHMQMFLQDFAVHGALFGIYDSLNLFQKRT